MHNGTFLELARTWKYAGLPHNVEFTFLPSRMKAFNPYLKEAFEQEAHKHMYTDIREAEAYFISMLEKAVVPGAVTYTLSGGRRC